MCLMAEMLRSSSLVINHVKVFPLRRCRLCFMSWTFICFSLFPFDRLTASPSRQLLFWSLTTQLTQSGFDQQPKTAHMAFLLMQFPFGPDYKFPLSTAGSRTPRKPHNHKFSVDLHLLLTCPWSLSCCCTTWTDPEIQFCFRAWSHMR